MAASTQKSIDTKDRGTICESDTNLEQEIKRGSKLSTGNFEEGNRKSGQVEGEGHIYVMQDKPDRSKIGCSKNPESRLRQLQTGNVDLRLVYKEYVISDMHWRESQVHTDIYNKYRLYDPEISSREWYTGCTLDYLIGIIQRHASR